MRQLDVDGVYVETDGPADGDPVLLLHAGVTDRRVWDLVMPVLAAAGHLAIRYDSRGAGRSPATGTAFSLVAEACSVLDAVGAGSAHWVGLSQGAATSVDTALAHPWRVRSLTLAAPGLTGFDWPQLPGKDRWLAALERDDRAAGAEAVLRLWGPLSFDAAGQVVDELAARTVLDQADWFFAPTNYVEEPPAIGRLGEIGVPTLVVLGDRDLDAVARVGELLVDGIPGARAVTLGPADHLLPLRVPDQLHSLLLAQLA